MNKNEFLDVPKLFYVDIVPFELLCDIVYYIQFIYSIIQFKLLKKKNIRISISENNSRNYILLNINMVKQKI